MSTTEAIPVHLYFALDRTGSMARLASDVIGGFKHMLADQQAKPGECYMTLIQFDAHDPFEILVDAVPIADVPQLTAATYVPRGGTPLLDAEGMLISRAEQRVAARQAAGEGPEAIVFGTYTDGLENASREWTLSALTAKKREHQGDWAFLYLGVGHDAYAQASAVGTQAVNTVSVPRTAGGTQIAYDFYAVEVGHVRDRAAGGETTGSHETGTGPKR
jgi:hypothetical protein